MIIGFDGSRAFLRERTGTENYSYQLLKNLAKIDHKNQYIVYLRPGLTSQGQALQGWPGNFKFKIINFPRLWTQVGLALQTFKDNLDVLFVPSHTFPLFRKPGLKTVMTVHDLGSEYLPSMHQLKQRLYLDFITKFQLKTATKLIAVSKATRNDVVKKVGIDLNKVQVIYEGVDTKVFKPIKDDILVNTLSRYDLKPKTYFLFVGTIQPRKNLKRLIIAFKNVILANEVRPESELNNRRSWTSRRSWKGQDDKSKLKLILAGQKGWMSDDIYKLPKKLRIEVQVKFLGHISNENLPALYSGAIALVFPSLYEGFGLPILEAFACGCPVITSNTSSMPEVAGDAALLVDPNSIDEIKEGMVKLTTDDILRDELITAQLLQASLIEKGFKQVKKFSWEKCARETLKAFGQL